MAAVKREKWIGGLVACCFFYWAAFPILAASRPNSVLQAGGIQPTNELSAFRVAPGFRVQLVASEPMVTTPVAMAFDENGRLFVVETRIPPSGAGSAVFGRVRLLEHPDTNGVFQTSTIYAQDLPRPTAIACYAGGVFVGLPSEIRYFKDTRGDGNADLDKVVLTGFGGTNASGTRAALNSFTWGLQNRFYGNTAGIDGRITAPTVQGSPLSLAGSDFSFDARTLAVLPEAGPAQSGLSFDDWGNKFVSDYARPLRLAMYEPRYTARNPFFPRLPALVDIASPATAIYRFVPALAEAPSRGSASTNRGLPFTRQLTNELVSTWLTNASGCVVYRGHTFPTNYFGNVFLAAPDAHVVHRMILRQNELGMTAERSPDERTTEFLVSSDPGFHPVQVLNGPEGALYIADLRDGDQQGRIYRVVPANFRQPKVPELARASQHDLVALLAQPDGWYRDTAARLLFEHKEPDAVPLLTNMLTHSRLPLARMQALHALAGIGGLAEAHVLRALRDTDARVREHGVLVAEGLISNGNVSDALWLQLKPLAADASFRVRYQLAFTLGAIRRPDRALVLGRVLNQNAASPWMQNAVLSSVAEGAGDLYRVLASDARFRNAPIGQDFLDQLALLIGVKGRMDEVAQTTDFIARAGLDRFQAYRLLYALGDGLHRTRSSFGLVDSQGSLQSLFSQAFYDVQDSTLPESARVAAVRLLGVSPYRFADVSDWLLILCNPHPLTALRAEAITTLGRYDDPAVLPDLLSVWPGLTPPMRQHAVSVLLSRVSRVAGVLQAIENGKISVGDLAPAHIDFLRTYRDPNIRERALRLFGPVLLRRPEAEQQFASALRLRGAADRGRATFQARCAECHAPRGLGRGLGPSLVGARTGGREGVLSAILEPNLNVTADQATCVVETNEGENLLGILEDDNPDSITLRQPGGVLAVWPRLNVQSVEIQRWSLMPGGLEQGLSPGGMADLLEYLMTTPDLETAFAGAPGR